MRMRLPLAAIGGGAFMTGAMTGAAMAQTPTDVELSLLIDSSGSIDTSEFNLQLEGYALAFEDATIQMLIEDATNGVTTNFVFWSGAAEQQEAIPFTQLNDGADADAFATTIRGLSRPFSGLTAPGSAINFATPMFATNTFDGDRLVIDMSGDGVQNDGDDTATARDAALVAGIDQVNGLAIGGPVIEDFYLNNVQGGTDSFTVPAADFVDFADAFVLKLGGDITGVPPPTAISPE